MRPNTPEQPSDPHRPVPATGRGRAHPDERCDPEFIALTALGEHAASDAQRAHLQDCATCQAELAALADTVRLGRTLTVADHLQPPAPDRVWASILDELDERPRDVSDPLESSWVRPPTVPHSIPTTRTPPAGIPATGIGSPRGRWFVAIAAAAVLGLAAGAITTWTVGRPAAVVRPAVIATAVLDPLGSPTAHGTAIVDTSAGSRQIRVELTGGAAPDRYLEVWVADTATRKMVAVGVLDAASHGTFTLPPGLDLTAYPVVDVSAQPYNGDPAHSADSVARGRLTPG